MQPGKQKVHWNRFPFLCHLTVTVVLVISEGLYCKKLCEWHYISYLIKFFLILLPFFCALTSVSAVSCFNAKLDSIRFAYADILDERCKCFFAFCVRSKQ